jgi:hypothetical protein
LASQRVIEVVTDPAHASSIGDVGAGLQALRDEDVVAELRRLEGLSAAEARRLGRETVLELGGYVEPRVHRDGGGGRRLERRGETWWLPRIRIRSTRAEPAGAQD